MNELCKIIKNTVKPNFLNIKTSIQTYDREALCCGVPCWRWVYHRLVMPVTVRLNHAIADGHLVANVFRLLEQEIKSFMKL